ncbi:MAG: hypothetical protein LBH03_00535 [Holophagales bacterium]|jgi:tetratricopeptide (TPR) repeat protein|nr:hypothetical protein [Holophagales bacterium]
MRTLNTAAIIAFAYAGLMAQTPIGSYAQLFSEAKPELDSMMTAMQYTEVVEKVKAILPDTLPAFEKDAQDPQRGFESYLGLNAIMSFNIYLGRALVMSGDSEGALSSFKKAEEIASQNAVDIESIVTPMIENWTTVIEENKKNMEKASKDLEEAATIKKDIEAKPGKNKKEKEKNEETLANLGKNVEIIEKNMAVWEENLKKGPDSIEKLTGMLSSAKEDTKRFESMISSLANDLQVENETINDESKGKEAKYKGNKSKYVTDAANSDANYYIDKDKTVPKSQPDKIMFLNRLLFLDPKNTVAKHKLDVVLGKAEEPAKTTRPAPKSPAKK